MALPSSGKISLGDIQAEFGGSNPAAISEYYGADSGVPTSGTISLSDFHGTSAAPDPVVVAITDRTLENGADGFVDFDNEAGVRFNNNGTLTLFVEVSQDTTNEWSADGPQDSVGTLYQVRATLVSGSGLKGSSLNSWINIDLEPRWFLERSSEGVDDAVIDVDIRLKSSGALQDSARYTLQSTVSGSGS